MTREMFGRFKLSAIEISLAIGLFACEVNDGATGPIGEIGEQVESYVYMA